jgi:hypothetical protein
MEAATKFHGDRDILAKLAPASMRFGRSGRIVNLHGRGGIRTPEAGVARLLVFKTSAFNRSATLPCGP